MLEAQRTFDPYGAARRRLHDLVARQVERQNARLASLRKSLVPHAEVEALAARGNAVLAMAGALAPGQCDLLVDLAPYLGDMAGNRPQLTHIALDPSLSPAQNAHQHFLEYRRLKQAAIQVPSLIQETEHELAYLQQLHTEVDIAEDRTQIDEVERELGLAVSHDLAGGRNKLTGKSRPLSARAADGTAILVGRNSQQNDEVTFRRSSPDDLWLHAHGVPGSHVIIRTGGGPVSEQALLMAARLAVRFSAARGETKAQVDYTARRHVRPIKNARPGMVTYRNETTITVVADSDGCAEERT